MMTSKDLTCKEVVELVSDYLEHALLPEVQKQVEKHVGECPGCTIYLEQIQKTIVMLRGLAEESVFPETKQQLLEVFRGWKKTE